jgi:hypothetical protein
VEQAVEKQADVAPELAAQFVPLKQEFGPLQKAYEVGAEGAARAAGRGILGLPEWMALIGKGTPAALAVKAGRKMLPQSLGYAAWRAGQALTPETQALLTPAATAASLTPAESMARVLVRSLGRRLEASPLVPAYGEDQNQ